MSQITIKQIDISGVPGILVAPDNPLGGVVLAHSYGGNKEELLGLAWKVAAAGFAACSIDLRGHGQNPLPLNNEIAADMNLALDYCRQFGKVIAMGHSLGGRLAMTSSADFKIGLSPALGTEFGDQTKGLLTQLRSYRVREASTDTIFEVISSLPDWSWDEKDSSFVVFGTRDVPEIAARCRALLEEGAPIVEIPGAFHGDIIVHEQAFEQITGQLRKWSSKFLL